MSANSKSTRGFVKSDTVTVLENIQQVIDLLKKKNPKAKRASVVEEVAPCHGSRRAEKV